MDRRARPRTPTGNEMFALMVETLQLFFRLRTAGARIGAVTQWGGGTWGLLRTLKVDGPRTVPQVARARQVARQHIQKLGNELAAAGLIEFVDNPGHRRSRLMRVTPRGELRLRQLTERIRDMAEDLARGMSEHDLHDAVGVLRALRSKLEGQPAKANGGHEPKPSGAPPRRRRLS